MIEENGAAWNDLFFLTQSVPDDAVGILPVFLSFFSSSYDCSVGGASCKVFNKTFIGEKRAYGANPLASSKPVIPIDHTSAG